MDAGDTWGLAAPPLPRPSILPLPTRQRCCTMLAMRSSHVMIRLTEAEAADLERAASGALLAVSTWARVTLLTVARRGAVPAKTAKAAKVARPRARKHASRRETPKPAKTSPVPSDDQRPAVASPVGVEVAPAARCSRHKRVGCAKDPECVRETTVFRV